jgi:NAD(P)-dependent dehydrogenase (short-subunit alcohol dehydrogenase family)
MSGQEDPVTAYPWQISAQDQQGGPGLDKDMKEQANWTQLEFWDDNGKPYLKEYEGRGLLQDKAVLITGGDSGIGRSVAILMAREGADVSILYLPEEEVDAKYTITQIEKAGRKGHGMAYDLRRGELQESHRRAHQSLRQDQCAGQQRFHASLVRRPQGDRPRHRHQDVPDQHYPDDRAEQVRSAAHEARR